MADFHKSTIEFLSICDGTHQLCKGIHWSTDNKSEHLLVDEIDDAVLEYQDKIAECAMGSTGIKFKIGDLKALLPEAKDTKGMLDELEHDVLNYKHIVGEDLKASAFHNILDDFLTDIYKWKYLATLT